MVLIISNIVSTIGIDSFDIEKKNRSEASYYGYPVTT